MESQRSTSKVAEGGLPSGWKREEVVRKSGLSAGKTDVYYFSPDGKKIRSKPQLARYIGEALDLSAFDFRTGRLIYSAVRKSKRMKGSTFDFARGIRHDASLILPIRQTASIFKQPVTVIRNRPESQTKSDLKHGPQDPPKQLFWEKRLQGLQARDSADDPIQAMDLPRNMQPVGPEMTNENVLQSISAALHLSNIPITGQNGSKTSIQKNPGVNIDANQPHIQQMLIHEEDIRRQESKVTEARLKLQDALNTLAT
ncbi:methyl-CpG-binding domain protein 2-like isoform X1 [Gigantopelta aegis]|uniref:methyl-CpG-binding domain protein 2-like isoform X1 n=1 Tax=Gigantopelta aegis TaxID=1735272 RepID=UPI001B887596|nr:methyl-CpG-binding domain protein 2-like isoform X1 [Gigantopelta aegis]XP_041371356.1 methyl-CpG-binding domain protein 2-like isoform X1 [Gigantopelta aegis]